MMGRFWIQGKEVKCRIYELVMVTNFGKDGS
jgi:hypothetical protein